MGARKKVTTERDGYRFLWWNGEPGMICVNAYKGDETQPCLEWEFGKIAGGSLIGNAAVWEEQALIYAKNPPGTHAAAVLKGT